MEKKVLREVRIAPTVGRGGKVCWPLGRGGSVGGRKSKGTFTSMVSSFLFMICFLLLQLNPALKCE